MPGGTPKKTAQVEESLRRPRKRPGHSKVAGEATGTRPRFLEASNWPMLASRLFGTSDTSTSSMCARQALSEVSLRSSTEAKVPLPFTSHSLRDLAHCGPQGPREVFRQVIWVFEPDREPQQVLGGGGPRSLYGRPVLDVAVRPPEASRPREHPDVGSHGHRALPVALHEEREHPTEEGHLLGGHPVPGVRLEPGVEDLGDRGVPVQETRDPRRVLRVRPHAVGQGLDAPEGQPALEGRGDPPALRVLDLPDLPERPVVALGDHHPSHHVRVAAQVLRRRVHHQVGPELEGALQDRRGPGVVAGEQGPCLPGDLRDPADVGDLQAGIRGRLDPEQPRTRPHGPAHLLRVRHIDEGGLHAPAGEKVPEAFEFSGPNAGPQKAAAVGSSRRRRPTPPILESRVAPRKIQSALECWCQFRRVDGRMMTGRPVVAASLIGLLDRSSPEALHRQLYGWLREEVLSGRLAAGTRLPSTRALAAELGVSRNTMTGTILPLLSEGYLEGRVGSGTYVSRFCRNICCALGRGTDGRGTDGSAGPRAKSRKTPDGVDHTRAGSRAAGSSWRRRRPRRSRTGGGPARSAQECRHSTPSPIGSGSDSWPGGGTTPKGDCSATASRPATAP